MRMLPRANRRLPWMKRGRRRSFQDTSGLFGTLPVLSGRTGIGTVVGGAMGLMEQFKKEQKAARRNYDRAYAAGLAGCGYQVC